MSELTTDYGFSYEYAVDINLAETVEDEASWQTFRFLSNVDPQTTPVTLDAATYDDHGAPNETKISESWTLSFTVQQQRTSTGEYLPEVERVLELAGPDAVGHSAVGHFRWYDDPVSGEPNPSEAFEGFATVEMNRAQTGNAEIGAWTITLTGKGRRVRITNPASTEG